MAQTTANSVNITRQVVYDTELQESFDEHLLGTALFNDMTADFPDGDEFLVDQIGDVTLSDYEENEDIDFTAIDTSRITLRVTDYPQDGFYMTDKLNQDSHKSAKLFAKRIRKSSQAFMIDMESDALAACNAVQAPGDQNEINGQPHRAALAAAATAQDVVDAIADIKLSFDKARVPDAGRIMIVDSTLENKLNKIQGGAVLVSDSPRFESLLETGFSRNFRFLRHIHGFDIMTSNLLPRIASETVDGTAVTDAYCNIAMCVADEDCRPIMGVIRQRPTAESERNAKKKRDEWSSTARWGFATYRPESVYCLLTEA